MRTFGEKISASADADQVAEAGVRIRDRGLVGIGGLGEAFTGVILEVLLICSLASHGSPLVRRGTERVVSRERSLASPSTIRSGRPGIYLDARRDLHQKTPRILSQ